MSDFERGWRMYAAGIKMIEEAKGWPKIKAKRIAEGKAMLLEGARLAHGRTE